MNWHRIAEYLATMGHELSLSSPPRQFAAGAANLNFLLLFNDKPAVLRRPPDGPLPPGANDVAREYRVLSRLWRYYPYAPRALLYCDDLELLGVPFCISEFIEGETLGDSLPESIAYVPDIGRKLGELVLSAMAELHAVDYSLAGLSSLGQPAGYLDRQIAGWLARGKRVLNDSQQMRIEKVCAWLGSNLPEERPVCLVHNDFKLDNMLVDLDSLSVRGVVDWDMCTLGDPILELAILLLYWGGDDIGTPYTRLARMPSSAEGWMSRREVVEYYLNVTGTSLPEASLRFYLILALARFAVVYAQLAELYSHGQMRSSSFDDTEDGVVDLVDDLLTEALAVRDSALPW